MAGFYPVFLDLRDRLCVVVGGDPAAEGKARELLAAGARVVVVAEVPGPGIEELARGGCVRLRRRAYRDGDLAGAFLGIATPGAGAGPREAVWREAERRGLPFNSVDDPWHCSFLAGSVVRRGDLTIAISTGGKAPALAVRLRQRLEELLGGHHARFLELAGTVRAALAARHPDAAGAERRRELWYRLVDSDVLDLLRRGDEATARRRFAEILGVEPAAEGAVAVEQGTAAAAVTVTATAAAEAG